MTRQQLLDALPSLQECGQYNCTPKQVAIDAMSDVEMQEARYVQMEAEIIKLLNEGIVKFKFFRVTYGSSRNALGTLNPDLYFYVFKGGEAPKKPGLFRYFDVVRGGWRSFYLKNVEKFELFDIPDLPDLS